LDLFVVIGAISQGFGGVCQDRLRFADYLNSADPGAALQAPSIKMQSDTSFESSSTVTGTSIRSG
jgi:hypothetical protein